ncbi:MAG TPA: hypothetical protein VIJ25_14570 [Methylococcales bacterium]
MEAPRVKEMRNVLNSKPGPATWEEKVPGVWVCEPSGGEDFYFSLEGWRLDRLTYE